MSSISRRWKETRIGWLLQSGWLFAQMQASLLRKSPRHTHAAQPHTEKPLEGKVQEIGSGCLQVVMAWMARLGGSQCISEAGRGTAAAVGCLKVRSEALQDGLLTAEVVTGAGHPFLALVKGLFLGVTLWLLRKEILSRAFLCHNLKDKCHVWIPPGSEGAESPTLSKGRQLWSCRHSWSQDAEVQEVFQRLERCLSKAKSSLKNQCLAVVRAEIR